MGMRARVEAGRLQRDALERLQEELLEVRRQRDGLPHENAALEAQRAQLEQEVRALCRDIADARAETRRPAPSLPERLVPPFHVRPSRRTAYGRLRVALGELPSRAWVLVMFGVSGRSRRAALLTAFLFFALWLNLLLQGPGDDGIPTWSFEEEGFSGMEQPAMGASRMRYADIARVEVRQGWLQRRFGLGSVRVTAKPTPPLPGQKQAPRATVLTLRQLDEPQRLADWLHARAQEAGHVR